MYESVREVKYGFLVSYLKARVENNEYIDRDELKRILIALGFEIREKDEECKENLNMEQ